MRRSRRFAALVVMVFGGVALASGDATPQTAGGEPIGKTSPVRATAQNGAPARTYEPPTLLVDPTDPDTVVAGTMELSSGTCQLLRSRNGGRSWTLLDKTPSPTEFPLCFRGGVYGYLNETPMDWGRDRALYWGINGLDAGRPDRDVSVLVARSPDLGDSWTSTVVADGRKATVDPAFVSRPVTGLAVDSRNGAQDIVYVAWQTFPPTGPRLVKLAVSTDAGKTFSEPKNPYSDEQSTQWGGAPGLEALPPILRVTPDGTLYVLFPARSADTSIPHRLLMAKSNDQGRTFTITEIALPVEANSTPTFRWTPGGGPEGTLHVVWEDRRIKPLGGREIFYARSTDGGATFSSPRLINDDDPQQRFSHFNPNMDVAPDGRIDLVWWDFRDGAALYATDVYYAYSYDNGTTWSRNFRVTDRSIDRRVGTWSNNFDYRAQPSIASTNELALMAWDDTSLATPLSGTQDVVTTTVQLAEVPAESSALPYVVAALIGLAAGGLALLMVAGAFKRRGEIPGADERVSTTEKTTAV